MARKVGWTTNYNAGQDRLSPSQSLSGMLKPRPYRRRPGTTLRAQRPRRRR
jgi:hypothetical protein